jgi:hypothetical protein
VRGVPLVLAGALLLAGCAYLSQSPETVDQHTSQGPTAEELWKSRVVLANGRAPTFEETRHFLDDLDGRIAKYLREHEAAASDPLTLQSFRLLHQAVVGMDKEQVEILLGQPFSTTDDAQQMSTWARRHWPDIRGRADLAWTYPGGWILYFDKNKLVDITQYLKGMM